METYAGYALASVRNTARRSSTPLWLRSGLIVAELCTVEPEESGLTGDPLDYFLNRSKGALLIPKAAVFQFFLTITDRLRRASKDDIQKMDIWNALSHEFASRLSQFAVLDPPLSQEVSPKFIDSHLSI